MRSPKNLIQLPNWASSVQSIMGATDSLRSIKTRCFSEEMPIFIGFCMLCVSAGFVRIRASLWVAEVTYR